MTWTHAEGFKGCGAEQAWDDESGVLTMQVGREIDSACLHRFSLQGTPFFDMHKLSWTTFYLIYSIRSQTVLPELWLLHILDMVHSIGDLERAVHLHIPKSCAPPVFTSTYLVHPFTLLRTFPWIYVSFPFWADHCYQISGRCLWSISKTC